jgi:methyl-accepting chemotaxis protein
MNLRNLRIGVRLAIGFSIILAMLIFVVVAGNMINASSTNTLVHQLETANAKTMLASEMENALLKGAIAMRNTALQSEVSATQKEGDKVKAQSKRYATAHDKLVAIGLTEGEKKILLNIEKLDKEMVEPFMQVTGLALIFDPESAGKVIASSIEPLSQKALEQINQLVAIQQEAATAVMANTVVAGKKLQMLLYLIGAIATAIGVACAWILTRSITHPLRNAVSIAQAVAEGDLTSQVRVVGKDEVSQLLDALKKMNDNLFETVTKVRQGTDTIATASMQIAVGNLDLSSRTEQQASSLEETAASMEELTSTVKQNADNARQANQFAGSASDVAIKGGTVVSQVIETMASIHVSSKKIVDIISVIDGIAFQTNILALNAAVEAARAGEQGRGFAVVAAEVRNLAQRAAGAAKEINGLIAESVDKVAVGTKLVDQAGATMDEIVESVKRVTDIMGEITAASQEQTTGIEQVNQAINQMDQVTQQNAALVEQAAAAAQSLQDQAGNLSQVVSIFKLGSDSAANVGAITAMPAMTITAARSRIDIARPVLRTPPTRISSNATLKGKPVTPAKTAADENWEEF